ncbi:hypothetical protein [Crocinitomix catalasitica]|uniref:hypothetical protein n=1 Tax=Crocinitomix catalasitica TaxID=184607 RepID=UPI0004823689|nr:hypothetical protein [Crocinitomix catalasitica]
MIRLLFIYSIWMISDKVIAQNSSAKIDVNKIFELKIDSIEQRITIHKWGVDTSCFLHFQVKNISRDTLGYLTNTCFYYNHCSLTIGNLELDLNAAGGCPFNSYKGYKLAPAGSFIASQWITALNLNKLIIGEWNMILHVPLVADNPTRYRVGGRSFVEHKQFLKSESRAKVVKTTIDNRKWKRKKKQLKQANQ